MIEHHDVELTDERASTPPHVSISRGTAYGSGHWSMDFGTVPVRFKYGMTLDITNYNSNPLQILSTFHYNKKQQQKLSGEVARNFVPWCTLTPKLVVSPCGKGTLTVVFNAAPFMLPSTVDHLPVQPAEFGGVLELRAAAGNTNATIDIEVCARITGDPSAPVKSFVRILGPLV